MPLADDDELLFKDGDPKSAYDRSSAVVRRYSSVIPPPGETTELPVTSEDAILRALAELGGKLEAQPSAQTLAETFVRTVAPLFPSRHVDVVLLEAKGLGFVPFRLHATLGRSTGTVHVSKDAVFARGLTSSSVERVSFVVSPHTVAAHEGNIVGMERLLADDGKTLGLLVVEHPQGASMSPLDLTRLDIFADILERAFVALLARRDTAALRRVVRGLAAPGPMPIALFRRDGTPSEQSEAWTELFGHGDADDAATVRDAVARVVRDGDPVVRITLRAASDTEQGSVACDVVAAGDHVAVVARDLATIRELEARVAHAERLASLGQFVASIAHELNNPLTITSSNAEFLDRRFELGEVTQTDRGKIRRILDATRRMQRFARDIVSYARPAGGNPTSVDVARLVKQAAFACEHISSRDRITVTLSCAEDVGQVWGVRDQLEQVLVNLVTNACHATGAAGHVRVHASRPSQNVVELRVGDDGPGVPAALREDIFRPFFTTKRDSQGTGLGLAIVRNLVERHAGRVSVEDAPTSRGATFVVTLPGSPYVTTE